jgi:hypothetical protein
MIVVSQVGIAEFSSAGASVKTNKVEKFSLICFSQFCRSDEFIEHLGKGLNDGQFCGAAEQEQGTWQANVLDAPFTEAESCVRHFGYTTPVDTGTWETGAQNLKTAIRRSIDFEDCDACGTNWF